MILNETVKVPKGEVACTYYRNLSHRLVFVVTYKQIQDMYHLYQVCGQTLTKLGKGASPLELEKRFGVDDQLNKQ